jgi:hypothetical protein
MLKNYKLLKQKLLIDSSIKNIRLKLIKYGVLHQSHYRQAAYLAAHGPITINNKVTLSLIHTYTSARPSIWPNENAWLAPDLP